MKTTPLVRIPAAGLLAVAVGLTGCSTRSASRPLEDPNDAYVTLEPVVGTRIKKKIRKSELNGYVGVSPTSKRIITAETDTMVHPSMPSSTPPLAGGP